jgi:hypothetical protein
MTLKAKGSCLCGSVKFSFNLKHKHFDACHCSMCRSWGGGPALTVESDGNPEFVGTENISLYSSSEWAERGFCKQCGSNLFYRMKDPKLKFCNFNLGTIENNEEFEFTIQIYVDTKPDNYSFANQTKMMTEKEVLDSFGFSDD